MRLSYTCASSMEYFHWFHGQQTRLHDANNTPDAAVGTTYSPRWCFANHDSARGSFHQVRKYVWSSDASSEEFGSVDEPRREPIDLNFSILTSIGRVRSFAV